MKPRKLTPMTDREFGALLAGIVFGFGWGALFGIAGLWVLK